MCITHNFIPGYFITIMSSIFFPPHYTCSVNQERVITIYHLSTMGLLFFSNPMNCFHFYTICFLLITVIYTPDISIVHLETISSKYWHITVIKDERILSSHIFFFFCQTAEILTTNSCVVKSFPLE